MTLATRIFSLGYCGVLAVAGSLAAAPANDNFANAIALTSNVVTVVGSNIDATKELMEPSHAGNQGGSSVWWSWTAQQSGFLTVSTAGSTGDNGLGLDTTLGVYRGSSLATLIKEAANDDEHNGLVTSRVEFFVAAGTTYHIAVDGYSLDGINIPTGTIRLALSFAALPSAPGWVLPDVTGQMISSTNFQGKVMLLNFWATTCLPCIAETPDLIALHTKYTNDGFSVIGISVDAAVSGLPPSSLVSAFLTDHQINYPVAMSRPGSNIETNYGGVGTLPTTFIIDRDNRIVHVLVGARTQSLFETLVKPLIYANLRASAGLVGDNLRLSWPVTAATVGIEATDGLAPPDWQPISFSSQIEGTNRVLSLPNPGTNRFYRLKVE